MKSKEISVQGIRNILNSLRDELLGCEEDLSIACASLETVSGKIESYTDAKCRECTDMPDEIKAVMRDIESVRRRLDGIL